MNIFFNSLLKNWKTKTDEIYKEKGKKNFVTEKCLLSKFEMLHQIFLILIYFG
jgi:hypothetical protein